MSATKYTADGKLWLLHNNKNETAGTCENCEEMFFSHPGHEEDPTFVFLKRRIINRKNSLPRFFLSYPHDALWNLSH